MKKKITRDAVRFTVGLGLTINEAVSQHADRPWLLVLFAGMMGVPFATRLDEWRRNGNGSKKES